MEPMTSPSNIAENMPNAAMMNFFYMPLFGNLQFVIQPSQSGEVSNTFGTMPYLSVDLVINLQQSQAQTLPTATTSSANTTGQQNITGAVTLTDSNGNIIGQMSAGNLPATGAATTAQPTSAA